MTTRWIGALTALMLLVPLGLQAQEDRVGEPIEARVWLDRGDEPVLQRGDRVRLYYRTSMDAYVAIFHIDTDGSVQLLFPAAPDEDNLVGGARDFRLLFPRSPYWYVDEYPGQGYFFMVASTAPLDFGDFDYVRYERGWDLTRVGRTVYEDPYLAIDDYVARLIPDWETVPYALDFITYDVGQEHDYPRFLCYDCHGYRAYAAWNPYSYACSTFRVVVWDDPYFYPAYRYAGTRVVYVEPRRGVARFEFKERAQGEPWTPLTRTRQPPRRTARYVEPSVAQPQRPEIVPPRRRVVPSSQMPVGRSSPSGSAAPAAPAARRGAPSTRTRALTAPGPTRRSDPAVGRPTVAPRAGQRPVLQRRPTTGSRSTGRSVQRPPPRGSSSASPGGRVVTPSRPRSGGSASPGARRPTVRPSGSRPSVRSRPPARPQARPKPSGSRPSRGSASRPPRRRKPGGGGERS